jgi:hypothetical protein
VKKVVTNCEDLFGPWVCYELGSDWFEGRGRIIGLMETGRGPIAGVLFESFNGASVIAHIAATGKNWLNREFLWHVSYYPFMQLGVRKVLAPVESTNHRSIKWTEHFGFTLEATLKDAAPNGDLLIYSLTKDQCKWLDLKGKYLGYGQTQSSRRT